jgi:hypothetical protein
MFYGHTLRAEKKLKHKRSSRQKKKQEEKEKVEEASYFSLFVMRP